jgi:hypothetical protein
LIGRAFLLGVELISGLRSVRDKKASGRAFELDFYVPIN